MTKRLKLTQGLYALVDDDIYEKVKDRKWYADKNNGTYYTRHNIHRGFDPVTGCRKVKRLYLHRVVLGLRSRKKFADHKNGNGLDNRRKNLRVLTHAENTFNRRPTRSPYKGVNVIDGVYVTVFRHTIKGFKRRVGRFDCPIKAAEHFDLYSLYFHGDKGWLNFPGKIAKYRKRLTNFLPIQP